jgi:hypothetical protein
LGDSVDGGTGIDTLQLPVAAQLKNGTVINVENIKYVGFKAGIAEIVTLDFGGKAYSATGVKSIDLTGFGLEDKLIIAQHDGALNLGSAKYNQNRSSYISESAFRYTGSTLISVRYDGISWQTGATVAKLHSYTHSIPAASMVDATIQLTGLPAGLPDSQFVFV